MEAPRSRETIPDKLPCTAIYSGCRRGAGQGRAVSLDDGDEEEDEDDEPAPLTPARPLASPASGWQGFEAALTAAPWGAVLAAALLALLALCCHVSISIG